MAEDRTSGSSRIDMIVELLREGRGEMRELTDAVASLSERVTKLEAALSAVAPPAQRSLARDAGVATSATTIAVAVIMALQALGIVKAPVAAPLNPVPVVAPATP